MSPTADQQPPVVVDAVPDWRAQGLALAADVLAVLGPTARYVEHIGSTAIPGMAAKQVFDLQAGALDLAAAEAAFDAPLAQLGFRRSPFRSDHVPAGIDDDPGRWAKRLWSRRDHLDPARHPDVNLHVRLVGSPNERVALLFRDWFRAHPEAVPPYARFKQVLAGTVADTGTYADVKDPVVDLVIAVAEPWAAATGWTPGGVTGAGA